MVQRLSFPLASALSPLVRLLWIPDRSGFYTHSSNVGQNEQLPRTGAYDS